MPSERRKKANAARHRDRELPQYLPPVRLRYLDKPGRVLTSAALQRDPGSARVLSTQLVSPTVQR